MQMFSLSVISVIVVTLRLQILGYVRPVCAVTLTDRDVLRQAMIPSAKHASGGVIPSASRKIRNPSEAVIIVTARISSIATSKRCGLIISFPFCLGIFVIDILVRPGRTSHY